MEYADRRQKPRYSFGWGESYTSFTLSVLRAPDPEDLSLHIRITNTGSCSGYAVPMPFLQRMTGIAVARIRQLAAFDKLYLAPGESGECTLLIPLESFEQCGEDGKNRFVPGSFRWYLWQGTGTAAEGEFAVSS